MGCATKCAHQMKCLWTFVYGIRASRTNAECLHSCQKASDVVEMACEAASHYTACLLKARCASRGRCEASDGNLYCIFSTEKCPVIRKRGRQVEVVSNLHPNFFALKVRRDVPQPSIFVRSFRSFTNAFLLHKQPGITNAPRPFMMSWQRSDDTSGKFLFFHITH